MKLFKIATILLLSAALITTTGCFRKKDKQLMISDVYSFEELNEPQTGYDLLGQSHYVHDTGLYAPEYKARNEAARRGADKALIYKKYLRTDKDTANNSSIPVYEVWSKFYKKKED